MVDWTDSKIVAAGIAAVVALATSALTAVATERKFRRDFAFERQLERDLQTLLLSPRWVLRRFTIIKSHIGGLSDDELRKVLLSVGAIRFKSRSDQELWGLRKRIEDEHPNWIKDGLTKLPLEPEEVEWDPEKANVKS